ncbi:MAG TPA: pitrilysin family protein [Nitrospiria bacterium]|nr:pitrilysin family protein [Nitrospiria bacterium]
MPVRLFHKEVLDNGIRVVTEEIPFVKSVSLGIWVEVGSRDETVDEAGLSHFAEHMFFKGTHRRSARQIAQEMDGLGGELNAFTSRETTAFYANVIDEHLPKAVNLLADLFRHSVFRPVEIEREKRVVLEEIKMVEDDPEDLIHDLHTANVWSGSPLGRPILGRADILRSITRRQILDFLNRKYRPERIVISAAGRFNRSALIRQLDRLFRPFGARARRSDRPGAGVFRRPPAASGGLYVRPKKLEQAHLCLGFPGLPLNHRDRYGIYALNVLLGGGMSSRLFQEVREKRGLVYSIYSHHIGFQDTGMMTVYAASSPKAVRQVVQLTLRELEKLRERGVSRDELQRAVNQMKGGILLNLESTNSRMSRLAKDEIYFGRHFSLEETLHEINQVSRRQVRRLGDLLFDRRKLSLTVLGPGAKARPLKAFLAGS